MEEGEGKGAKQSENLETVKKTKSIPKPAGVLQGGEQPQPSEDEQVWNKLWEPIREVKIVKLTRVNKMAFNQGQLKSSKLPQ